MITTAKKKKVTPLTLRSRKAVVAGCAIKSPSTTGTSTKVPKNPARLILLLAPSRTVASTARKQAMESVAEVQLRWHGKLSLRAIGDQLRLRTSSEPQTR